MSKFNPERGLKIHSKFKTLCQKFSMFFESTCYDKVIILA